MKKALSLILAVLLIISMLCGCNSGGSSSSDNEASEAPGTSDEGPDNSPEELAEPEPEVTTALPISDELIEIDWFTADIGYLWSMMDDINENITLQELEKRTNVHLNWTFGDFEGNAFSVMLASGDWCDVVDNANAQYPGGVAAGVAAGVFKPLTDAINEYMPNYKALLEADETLMRDCTDSEGNINFISKIYKDDVPVMWGPFIRSDWCKELGYDPNEIDTYDEYHDVMLAMKTEYDMDSVLRLISSGVEMFGYLTYGYGINGELWSNENVLPLYHDNGVVKFGSMEDGFKEYLTMMNQWYKDGLISSDFVTITDRHMFDPDAAKGKYGVFYANIAHVANLYNMATDEGFELAPLKDATKNEGETLKFSGATYTRFSDNCLCILEGTEYLEEICRWLDYLYSEEGTILMNYGIEGESYEVVDGEIVLNKDWFVNCPYMPGAGNFNDVRTGMLGAGIFTCMLDYWGFYKNFYSDVALSTQEVWTANTPSTLAESGELSYFIDNYMTIEEAEEYTELVTDLCTYLSEMVPAFILGTRDINTEWDAFVNTQKELDVDRIIEIYQNAYDRYWA
ncbi:MAG: hypothetical protein ACOX7I_05435 [Oscillospiraceae bacterium]|jgi:putative aldouronate transport system substrate-binding protein